MLGSLKGQGLVGARVGPLEGKREGREEEKEERNGQQNDVRQIESYEYF